MVASVFYRTDNPPALTQRVRYRLGFRERLVLQVEEKIDSTVSSSPYDRRPGGSWTQWRDATVIDLQELKQLTQQ